jgi:hypothetical protein
MIPALFEGMTWEDALVALILVVIVIVVVNWALALMRSSR